MVSFGFYCLVFMITNRDKEMRLNQARLLDTILPHMHLTYNLDVYLGSGIYNVDILGIRCCVQDSLNKHLIFLTSRVKTR